MWRGGTLTWTLTDFLRAREALLVLDNCEHLVEASALLVEELLQSCPEVRVLATGRRALGILGKVAWPVRAVRPGPFRG